MAPATVPLGDPPPMANNPPRHRPTANASHLQERSAPFQVQLRRAGVGGAGEGGRVGREMTPALMAANAPPPANSKQQAPATGPAIAAAGGGGAGCSVRGVHERSPHIPTRRGLGNGRLAAVERQRDTGGRRAWRPTRPAHPISTRPPQPDIPGDRPLPRCQNARHDTPAIATGRVLSHHIPP